MQEQQVHVGERRELRADRSRRARRSRSPRAPAVRRPAPRPPRAGEAARADHDLVHLVRARGRAISSPAEPHAVTHAQPVRLELEEPLEIGEAGLGVRGADLALQALPRVGLDLLAVDRHGVADRRVHDACRSPATAGRDRKPLTHRRFGLRRRSACHPVSRYSIVGSPSRVAVLVALSAGAAAGAGERAGGSIPPTPAERPRAWAVSSGKITL